MRTYTNSKGEIIGTSKGGQGGCAGCLLFLGVLIILIVAIAGLISAAHGGQ